MDDTFAARRYSCLTYNSPLSTQRAVGLIENMKLSKDTNVIDLGCGWGELLLQAAHSAGCVATGIDSDPAVLARAKQAASDRKIDVQFREMEAATWTEEVERAICLGSSHAFGGPRNMFNKLADIVPQGRVLVGDTFWEKQPSDETLALMGEGIPSLDDLVKMARGAGWYIMHLSTATQAEWDDFESRHRAGPREWVLENPDHKDSANIKEQQDEREMDYLMKYRGVLGFAFLILAK